MGNKIKNERNVPQCMYVICTSSWKGTTYTFKKTK